MPPQILCFPLLCQCKKVCVISHPLCLCPAILFPAMPLWPIYIHLTERAEISVLRVWIIFEHSMCQKSISFPCSQVIVYLLKPFEASLRFPECNFFLPGWGRHPHAKPPTWRAWVSLFVWVITFDLSGLGEPASSYRPLSSQDHLITQAPPLRRSRDIFGGECFPSARKKTAPTVLMYMAFYSRRFLEILSRKFKIF